MSSQGSSSVRAASGVVFKAMSGDPLSRDVSTPNAFSIDPALEVVFRPTDKGDTEPE